MNKRKEGKRSAREENWLTSQVLKKVDGTESTGEERGHEIQSMCPL